VDVYEQRGEPGGIWNYTPQTSDDGLFQIPQTTASAVPLEKPVQINDEDSGGAVFLSAIYDGLEVNIPHKLMRFDDAAFPSDLPLFPGHADVRRYLHRYADDVHHLIQFNTRVDSLTPPRSWPRQGPWLLAATNLVTGTVIRALYDAVAFAHGHYTAPYVPDIPGLADWHAQLPGTVAHARYHRDPAREYGGTRAVVVGAGVSGLELARRLAPPVCAALFLAGALSADDGGDDARDDGGINAAAAFAPLADGAVPTRRLASVDAATRSVLCEGGRRISAVDRILLSTGYLYTLPFLPAPAVDRDSKRPIFRAGRGLGGLDARAHLFSAADPSIALLAAHQRVVPFPLAEAQACLLARAWAGRLPSTTPPPPPPIPPTSVSPGPPPDEHEDRLALLLGYPREFEYMQALLRWAATAAPGAGGLEGKAVPAGWGPRERWIREMLPDIRKAWIQKGAERSRIRTIEELGFVFKDG
jgi:hypothetical protein